MNNRFNNIGVTINKSGKDIDINIININRKIFKFVFFTPFCFPPVSQEGENYIISDNKNKEDIK